MKAVMRVLFAIPALIDPNRTLGIASAQIIERHAGEPKPQTKSPEALKVGPPLYSRLSRHRSAS